MKSQVQLYIPAVIPPAFPHSRGESLNDCFHRHGNPATLLPSGGIPAEFAWSPYTAQDSINSALGAHVSVGQSIAAVRGLLYTVFPWTEAPGIYYYN